MGCSAGQQQAGPNLYVPPAFAIAHHLISSWARGHTPWGIGATTSPQLAQPVAGFPVAASSDTPTPTTAAGGLQAGAFPSTTAQLLWQDLHHPTSCEGCILPGQGPSDSDGRPSSSLEGVAAVAAPTILGCCVLPCSLAPSEPTQDRGGDKPGGDGCQSQTCAL